MKVTARNQFKGKIVEIDKGSVNGIVAALVLYVIIEKAVEKKKN